MLLYQHLFWFWGHPEVYILFLPAVGMVSSIIPIASPQLFRAGYLWVVTAFLAIAFISFGVGAPHVRHRGARPGGRAVLGRQPGHRPAQRRLSLCWIATMLLGRVQFTVPMLFCAGFLGIFLAGGITGVMVAVLPSTCRSPTATSSSPTSTTC